MGHRSCSFRRMLPIRFKDTTIWQQHPVAAAGIIIVLVLQSLLISGLMASCAFASRRAGGAGTQRPAHHRARGRTAKDRPQPHDDFTQRLAASPSETAKMEGAVKDPRGKSAAHSIRERTHRDERGRSRDVVPPASIRNIEDLASREAPGPNAIVSPVTNRSGSSWMQELVPESLSPEPAFCLFPHRVESLRNVCDTPTRARSTFSLSGRKAPTRTRGVRQRTGFRR